MSKYPKAKIEIKDDTAHIDIMPDFAVWTCRRCGKRIRNGLKYCWHCGEDKPREKVA
jgi:rubrerythrin